MRKTGEGIVNRSEQRGDAGDVVVGDYKGPAGAIMNAEKNPPSLRSARVGALLDPVRDEAAPP